MTTPIEIVQAKNFRDKAQKHKNKSSQQKSIEHFFAILFDMYVFNVYVLYF